MIANATKFLKMRRWIAKFYGKKNVLSQIAWLYVPAKVYQQFGESIYYLEPVVFVAPVVPWCCLLRRRNDGWRTR